MKLSGQMSDMQIESKSLNRILPVICYTPPDYTTYQNYPLLIAQDGRDYIQIGRLASTADKWITGGVIRPVIIVAIPYETPASRWDLYYPEGSLYQAYLSALSEDVLPIVASTRSISEAPEDRTLIGDSLGGTISLMTALNRPDLFDSVIMQSPYCGSRKMMQQIRSATHLPSFIYHSTGRGETAVKTTRGTTENFLEPNRELHRILSSREPDHYIFVESGGIHTWRFWQPDIKRALIEKYGLKM
ncbi:alpha/beta hydrolase-fold protein [Sporolactobacillus sp. THM19-2]|uniref:alpha/beta hydrolase n=1 Tax=Sporolactobacillus sp. THM19-2 TaxID=2511171 RepID=UPI0013ECCBE4|nr:alpha/beta hydrolase-fold protein [Sporolactobacillus sp. THM19-2]